MPILRSIFRRVLNREGVNASKYLLSRILTSCKEPSIFSVHGLGKSSRNCCDLHRAIITTFVNVPTPGAGLRTYSSEPIFRVVELDANSAREFVGRNVDEDDQGGAAPDAPTPFPGEFSISGPDAAPGEEISYNEVIRRGQVEYQRLKKRKPTVPLEARRFVDMCRVDFVAGSGGHGCTSFYRSKVRRFGPPDGGNGGNGGDIIIEACDKTHCFKDIHSKYRGQPGTHGGSNKSAGRHGGELVVKVPVGTVIYHRAKTARELEREREEEELMLATHPSASIANHGHHGGNGSSSHGVHGGGGSSGGRHGDSARWQAELDHGSRHPGAVGAVSAASAASAGTAHAPGHNPNSAGASGYGGEHAVAMVADRGPGAFWNADKHREWLASPAGRPIKARSGDAVAVGRGRSGDEGATGRGVGRAGEENGDLDGGEKSGGLEDEDDEDWVGAEHSALEQRRRRNSREHIGDMVAELMTSGQRVAIARGGRGGRGNALLHQKKRSLRARSKGQGGEVGEVDLNRELGFQGETFAAVLELKSLADVGLVGAPNAGKSTLLGALSRAMPKTAAYPFTTLRPHLGRVMFDDAFALTVADIPGLLEGAHENKGLGHSFLRHIERTCVLAYVLDMAAGSRRLGGVRPWVELETLMRELEMYRPGICRRPSLIIANKMDEVGAEYALRQLRKRTDLPIVRTCSILGHGIPALAQKLREMVEEHRQKVPASLTIAPQEEKKESRPWTPAMEDEECRSARLA